MDFKDDFHNNRKKVIVKSPVAPGPQWKLLPVTFVLSEISGVRTATGQEDRFWLMESDC